MGRDDGRLTHQVSRANGKLAAAAQPERESLSNPYGCEKRCGLAWRASHDARCAVEFDVVRTAWQYCKLGDGRLSSSRGMPLTTRWTRHAWHHSPSCICPKEAALVVPDRTHSTSRLAELLHIWPSTSGLWKAERRLA